ncbi:hAT family dimerization domain-containing protein, partial [Devosia indica]
TPGRFPCLRKQFSRPDLWVSDVLQECVTLLKEIRLRSDYRGVDNPGEGREGKKKKKENLERDWLSVCPPPSATGGSNSDEWERYCGVRRVIQSTSSVLDWWRVHQAAYPTVSILAAEYLCIPASSASVERMFSVNGHQLNKRRRAMEESKVNQLTVLRDNLHLFRA